VTLRVGMIGAGNMARVHAGGWEHAGDDVAVVFDPDAERASALAADHGAVVAGEFTELVSQVDVVDICTPTHTHAGYITLAADAGLDIVCEKPLARTGPEAYEAVEACERAGVTLLVAHVVRFFPEYAVARERAVAGDIGSIGVVRLDRSTYLPAGASAWFRDRAKSGGVVYDLMIHDVDYARWVAGDVEHVYARAVGEAGGGNHVLATLRHTSGAISHIQGSWAYPAGSFRATLEIAGSEGLIQPRLTQAFTADVSVSEEVPDVPEPTSTAAESPYDIEMRHFSNVLQGREDARVTAVDGATAVAICDAIASSVATGRPVEVTS